MSNPLSIRIQGNLLILFSEMVRLTCRVCVSGQDNLQEALDSGKPLIGTSWHGMTQMVIASLRRFIDLGSVVTIIPDDYRGDILEIFANHLGIYPTKLNLAGDSSLETARRLSGVIRQIRSGRNFLIHPDGPAGPAYQVKPGLSSIAQKSGGLILPLGCYCRNAYHWHRWDRYTFPLPFSKIQVFVGEPLQIRPDLTDLTETNQHLKAILDRNAFQAMADYYERA